MIEVFKTNVTNRKAAVKLKSELGSAFPGCMFHFDLEDCDNILRVEYEGGEEVTDAIERNLRVRGFYCEVLNC